MPLSYSGVRGKLMTIVKKNEAKKQNNLFTWLVFFPILFLTGGVTIEGL